LAGEIATPEILSFIQTRITAAFSAIFLMTFPLAMALALRIELAVFSDAGDSLLLATCPAFSLTDCRNNAVK
jgi:hypothetical protein